MESKQNKATNNRPEGDRVLDGALVRMNIADSIRQIKNEQAWLNSDRNAITLLHSNDLRIVLMALKLNAEVAPHKLAGASFIQVLEGRVWMETLEQSLSLDAGDGLSLAPDLPRSFYAEEECVLLLTIAGVSSEDYSVDFNKVSTF